MIYLHDKREAIRLRFSSNALVAGDFFSVFTIIGESVLDRDIASGDGVLRSVEGK